MAEEVFDRERFNDYFNGNSSDDDALYVEKIISEGGYDRELKKLMSEQFDSLAGEGDLYYGDNLEKIYHTVCYNIANEELKGSVPLGKSFVRWVVRAAAVLFIPLLVYSGLQFYKHKYVEKETWVEIKAPAWTRAQFRLPDGTTGWLNSNSSVKYIGNFLRKRQVELTGEAYFDVMKNPSSPFSVTTGDIRLEVLGTRFSVSAYHDENQIEIVLEEGSLRFMNLNMSHSMIMKPNDLIVYDKKLGSISAEVVQPKKYLAWTEGALVFRNDPLDVIARRLGRWYNADVEVRNSIDTSLRLRATFIDENLEEVLKILELSLPIGYNVEDAALQSDSTYSRKKIVLFEKQKHWN